MYSVLQITTGHEVYDNRITRKICKFLSKSGFSVSLYVQRPKEKYRDDSATEIKYFKRANTRFGRLFILNFYFFLHAMRSKATILHFHDPAFLPYGIILAHLGKTVIYDVHEDYRTSIYDREWLPSILKYLSSKFIIFLENRMSRKGYICAATPSIRKYFPRGRTVTVQNYPSTEIFNHNRPFLTRPKRFVYVGTISEERGIYEILNAVKILNDKGVYGYGLDLIGDIEKNFLVKLKAHPAWPNVNWHGRREPKEVAEILGNSFCGLAILANLKRYRESQPTKIYEYIASGTPFIASNFNEWKKLFGEQSGKFIQINARALAEEMLYFLNNEDTVVRMSNIALKESVSKFSFENEGAKLVDFYLSIMREL